MTTEVNDRFNALSPVNGYSNYPTFATCLWASNDYPTYSALLDTMSATPEKFRLGKSYEIVAQLLNPRHSRPAAKEALKWISQWIDGGALLDEFSEQLDSPYDYKPIPFPAELPRHGDFRNEPTAIVARWLIADGLDRTLLRYHEYAKSDAAVKALDSDDPTIQITLPLLPFIYKRYELMKERAERLVYGWDDPAGLPADLLGWFFEYVDWDQVYIALGFPVMPEDPHERDHNGNILLPIGAIDVTTRSDIPDAPFYVCMNDSFFSGWGRADGKIATYIHPCSSLEQARIVEQNAINRGDQKYIRIVSQKPRCNFQTHCYFVRGPVDSRRFYRKGGWGCQGS